MKIKKDRGSEDRVPKHRSYQERKTFVQVRKCAMKCAAMKIIRDVRLKQNVHAQDLAVRTISPKTMNIEQVRVWQVG